jgi:hypothetical protein
MGARQNLAMALGKAKRQARFEDPRQLLGDRLKGVYRFLADNGDRLFPDDYFADLFTKSAKGRPTVPAPGVGDGDAAAIPGGVVGPRRL